MAPAYLVTARQGAELESTVTIGAPKTLLERKIAVPSSAGRSASLRLFTKQSSASNGLSGQPANEIYKKALEMTDKPPGLHAELQRQLAQQRVQQEAARAAQMGTDPESAQLLR